MKLKQLVLLQFNLSLKNKVLIYFAGYILLVFFFFLLTFQLIQNNTFLWFGIAVSVLSLFFALIISISASKHMQSIAELINNHINEKSDIANINLKNEFGELSDVINRFSDSVQVMIEERISYENLALLGEFAAFVIHDLKNPISGIHLLAEGLNKKIESNDEIKKYTNEILLASQKLDDFIKKTLDIAKPATMNFKKIDITELLENVLIELNLKEIKIEKHIDKSIPLIMGDYQLLMRAITNIMHNAIESIELKGKIIIEIIKEKNLIIKISDNGIGIDKEKLKSIFRPFYSSKGKGHGLGLAMVKKVIMMHQGSIHVDSKPGIGSTFIISLPEFNNSHISIINQKSKE